MPAILLFSAVFVLRIPNLWLDILVSPPLLFHLVLTSVSSARHTHSILLPLNSMYLSGFLTGFLTSQTSETERHLSVYYAASLQTHISRGESGYLTSLQGGERVSGGGRGIIAVYGYG